MNRFCRALRGLSSIVPNADIHSRDAGLQVLPMTERARAGKFQNEIIIATGKEGWSEDKPKECDESFDDACVGLVRVSQTNEVRGRSINLDPDISASVLQKVA